MLQTISKVALVVFIYFLLNSFFTSLHATPTEADSLYYHIPLAHSFLNGSFIQAQYGENLHNYFPAAAEILLAFFILLHIPVTLFNWLGIIALFGSGFLLAKTCKLSPYASILFAVSICLLQTVTRWVFAQTVDIWLAVFYLQALRLLIAPKSTWSYYAQLGVSFGFLVGAKYSGIAFAVLLIFIFTSTVKQVANSKKILVSLVLITVLGFFWYLRNWWVMSNPFYPLDSLFFTGVKNNTITNVLVWQTVVRYPLEIITAYWGEFALWSFVVFVPILALLSIKVRKKLSDFEKKLMALSGCNALVFLLLPSGDSYQLHVSQFRFSYVVFIPLILLTFILASKYKKEEVLSVGVVANLCILSGLPYYPKLGLLLLPISLMIFFPQQIKKLVGIYLRHK